MTNRVAVLAIVVENKESVFALNQRIPYREKKINVISIALDAPEEVINAVCGKIGRLDGVSSKTAYSNFVS